MRMEQRIDGLKRAFSRVELLAVGGAIGLLGAIALPTLAGLSGDSDRAVCANNLRLIGRAIQMWASDHGGRVPWWTVIDDGGTFPRSPEPGNAWLEYAWLSNQLVTPKILACPSDRAVRRAETWDEFWTPAFRNGAASYHVSLDVMAEAGRVWLSSDKNLRPTGTFNGCSSRKTNGRSIVADDPQLAWTNDIHGEFGHVLLNDGDVEFVALPRLRTVLSNSDSENGRHFLPVGQ